MPTIRKRARTGQAAYKGIQMTLKTISKEALAINGIDVKLLVYVVSVAFVVYFFFDGKIDASEQKMTQAIETVASDNLLATERITIEFSLFVLRRERNELLKIKSREAFEDSMLADTLADVARLEGRQRELDRLQLERRVSVGKER